jgi:hypothetical protein
MPIYYNIVLRIRLFELYIMTSHLILLQPKLLILFNKIVQLLLSNPSVDVSLGIELLIRITLVLTIEPNQELGEERWNLERCHASSELFVRDRDVFDWLDRLENGVEFVYLLVDEKDQCQ